MAGPRHLQDPLAHDEKFKALKEEVDEGLEEALSSMFIPGMTISFSGTFGGSDGKRPINPHTGKANEEFALCDGGTYKSPTGPMMTTPDMRGRFVLGAGGSKVAIHLVEQLAEAGQCTPESFARRIINNADTAYNAGIQTLLEQQAYETALKAVQMSGDVGQVEAIVVEYSVVKGYGEEE